MKYVSRSILVLVSICFIAACAGPRVPAYDTKPQKFEWGKAHVWMATVAGTSRGATTGEGYLLIDMSYKKEYLNKNCFITVNHVRMVNPESGAVLLDQTPLMRDKSPMTREIKEYRTGQFGFSGLTIKFDRDLFPYDVKIKMNLKCPYQNTKHEFSKKIRFRMVQPVLWKQ